MTDPNDLLFAGGAPSAKFPAIGAKVVGTIESAEVKQQTDINGTLLTWDNGEPKMQIVVSLLTDERDPSIEEDDGRRRLFVKGQMMTAVREAVRAGGGKLLAGGRLAVAYVGDGEQKTRGFSPPKLYKAQYEAPKASVDVDNLL